MIGQKSYVAKKTNTEPKWHVIDASGKVLGRVATEAASILRGKHKPEFTPNAKCGDYVIIINCAKAILTGNKLEQKEWIRHTGWIGGLKRVKYAHLMETRPELAMKMAVEGMLPHTSLGREQLTMLRVYAGAEHEHEAQVNAGTAKKEAKATAKKPAARNKETKAPAPVGARLDEPADAEPKVEAPVGDDAHIVPVEQTPAEEPTPGATEETPTEEKVEEEASE